MRRLALLCALLALAAPAWAHPVPFSYLDLRLDATTGQPSIAGTLTVHVFDAAHELSIDLPDRLLEEDVAAASAAALQRLLGRRLTISADRPIAFHVDGEPVAGGTVLEGRVHAAALRVAVR